MTDPVGPWGEDDARARHDVRSALGLLLADEPGAVWSPADDAVRGRTLQRRRSRWGAGVGLVAMVSLLLVAVGPWRPGTQPAQPGHSGPDSLPAVSGVDPDQLVALSRAFTAINGTAIDWSRSIVAGSVDGGLEMHLSLVAGPVPTGSSADPQATAGPVVAVSRITWLPRGGTGPVLAGCVPPACVRTDRGVFAGWTDRGGRWDRSGGSQQIGTTVIDREYVGGAVLEISSSTQASPAGGPAGQGLALSLAQVGMLMDLVGSYSSDVTPPPVGSGLTACRYGDVKPVPEADPVPTPFGVVALRVHLYPRNPDVHCTLDGVPTVRPYSGGKVVDGVTAQRGDPGGAVTLGPGEATFGVMLGGCFASAPDALRVTLPGDTSTADVSVAPLVSSSSFDCSRGSAPWVTVSGFTVGTTGSGATASPGGASASASAASPTPVASGADGARALTAAQASASGVRRCTLADLRVTQPWADGATGWNLRGLRVTNASASSCVVGGRPSVGLVAAGRPVQVPDVDGAGGFGLAPAPYAVLLPRGASAEALVAKFRCDVRTSGPVSALRVSLPGSAQTVDVAVPGLSMCAAPDPQADNRVSVSPFAVPRS